jgi:ATP-binding cassette subfamily B protein
VSLPRPLGGSRRRPFALLVAIGVGESGCGVLFALFVHTAVDRLTHSGYRGGSFDPFAGVSKAEVGVGMLLAMAAMAGLRAVGRPVAERLAQDYVHCLRLAMFDHVADSAVRDRRRRSIGVTVLRMTGDANGLRMWISRGLAAVVVGGSAVAGAVGALVVISPVLGAAAVAMVVLVVGVVCVIGPHLQERVRQVRRRRGRLNTRVNERITQALVVQAMGGVAGERGRLARDSSLLRKAMVRQARVDGVLLAVVELARSGLVVAAVAAGLLGGQSPGAVGAALTVVHLLGSPLLDLAEAVRYRQEALVARQRIGEMFTVPARLAAPPGAGPLAPGPGRLELDDVGVDGVFSAATAVVEAGQRVALRGEPGSGKATLLAVIARLLPPDAGAVRLDGQDLAQVDQDSARRAVRLVSAELPLLRGTVAQNLTYGGADPEVVDEVSELCGLDALMRSLPDGEKTRIGEFGQGLSRGQRRQLALARALVSKPRLLLLDDVDEVLDDVTRSLVRRLVADYPGTVVLTTRDPELLARVDAVWWLGGGGLPATGRERAAFGIEEVHENDLAAGHGG